MFLFQIIDQDIAFLGGLDLCFGRYDNILKDDLFLQRFDYVYPQITPWQTLMLKSIQAKTTIIPQGVEILMHWNSLTRTL